MDSEKLSTYAKGDFFEERVFDFLTKEIEAGRFFCGPEHCQITRKKSYYSRDRDDFIVFDIAIEAFLPGQSNPSLIVLIECKNYSGAVPVGDIEEFGSKIGQTTGVNAKGILVSAGPFQSGTLQIARNRGFGLIRWFDQAEFRWELPRALLTGRYGSSSRKRAEIEYALTHTSFQPTIYSAYGVTPSGYSDGWEGIWSGLNLAEGDLQQIRRPSPPLKPRVAFVSKQKIEELATGLLKSIHYVRGAVDLTALVAYEEQVHGLNVRFLPESESALGSITFDPPEIKIFATDDESSITRFTLAHELGHYHLGHGRYMTRESIRSRDIDQSQRITIPKDEVERLEWQANTFASCLLMPRDEFQFALGLLIQHHGIRNRGHGILYLDGQRDNVDNFWMIARALSDYFKVSVTAVYIRMKALGVLVEA